MIQDTLERWRVVVAQLVKVSCAANDPYDKLVSQIQVGSSLASAVLISFFTIKIISNGSNYMLCKKM